MSSMKKPILLSTCAALTVGTALGVMAYAAPAFAQTETAGDDDTIIVSARRRDESLLEVPLAISAFSAKKLEQIGAVDITNIQSQTPNVTFVVSRGTNSTLTAFIRGVGQQDPLWGFQPGVGLYLDDVYIARPQGTVLDIYEVERIEVLRGPQGSLYGRNSVGGAIKYVTKKLNAEKPEVMARINVGSYSQFDTLLSGSAPLITDNLVVGAALAKYTRDGFGENVLTGEDHYDKDVLSGRATIEFSPSEQVFFRLTGDFSDDDSNAKHGHRELVGVTNGEPVLQDIFDTRGGAGTANNVETRGGSFLAQWDINDQFTLKSISAYREGNSQTPIDFDGLPIQDFDVPAVYADDQFTQELQLLFNTDRIAGVFGLYYLDGNANGAFDVILTNLANPGFTLFNSGDVDSKSYSAFGDITFDLDDRWSLSLGGRYTSDKVTANIVRERWLGNGSGNFPNNPNSILLAVDTNITPSRTDNKFTPRASVNFAPNDDLNLYASFSQGFKSGGFDPRGNAALSPLVDVGFGPETVDNYELGAKGTLLDGAVTFSAAAFLANYTDQQITTQQGADADGDGINDTFVSGVFNAGKSRYKGFELETNMRFTDALSADFVLGYIDANINEILSAGVNVADQFVVQNTPELTTSASLNYFTELANDMGSINLRGSVSYRDDYFIFNVPSPGFGPGVNPLFPDGAGPLDPNSSTTLDASIIWNSPNDTWQLSLVGKNLTDNETRIAYYNFVTPSQLGVDSAYSAFYAPPLTVTAGIRFKY